MVSDSIHIRNLWGRQARYYYPCVTDENKLKQNKLRLKELVHMFKVQWLVALKTILFLLFFYCVKWNKHNIYHLNHFKGIVQWY